MTHDHDKHRLVNDLTELQTEAPKLFKQQLEERIRAGFPRDQKSRQRLHENSIWQVLAGKKLAIGGVAATVVVAITVTVFTLNIFGNHEAGIRNNGGIATKAEKSGSSALAHKKNTGPRQSSDGRPSHRSAMTSPKAVVQKKGCKRKKGKKQRGCRGRSKK